MEIAVLVAIDVNPKLARLAIPIAFLLMARNLHKRVNIMLP